MGGVCETRGSVNCAANRAKDDAGATGWRWLPPTARRGQPQLESELIGPRDERDGTGHGLCIRCGRSVRSVEFYGPLIAIGGPRAEAAHADATA